MQPLHYESYINLIRQLDELISIFEQHPDPTTREQVVALLGGVDMLHREGLTRLVNGLRQAGAEAALQQAIADPVVETLLGLYDLAELELPDETPPPTDFIPLDEIGINGVHSQRSPICLDDDDG